MIPKGFTEWKIATDAVTDRNGRLLYWPNRADRHWQRKQSLWRWLSRLGLRARRTAPIVTETGYVGFTQEYLCKPTTLTKEEMDEVHIYLADKYGIDLGEA